MASQRLRIDGHVFRDPHNREITLRGINVAGDAKCPKTPDVPSYVSDNFFDGDNVSFVGRPFELDEAHVHFDRLRKWGYNAIRYIFTWEAIEHQGPGKYDEDWIEFTISVLRLAKAYDFYVFMDPHQDVWSRFSGGSGAPMWTLYAAGFDPRKFQITRSAIVQNTYPNPEEYPKMVWSTNYTRLVGQTMFTLFFGGKDFAPKAIIDGKNIQDYLQDHYVAACRHLALRIHEAGDLEGEVVIGWESLNEPNRGLISYEDISVIPAEQQLKLGTCLTAFQAILTGSGRPCEVPTYAFGNFGPYQTGKELIDPEGETTWLSPDYDDTFYGWQRDPGWKLGTCLWAQHGVWDPSTDSLLQKDYFGKNPRTGKLITYHDFTNTYFMDHYRRFRDGIRSVDQQAILFCQPPVMEIPPNLKGTKDDDPNMVHAAHYYDGLTLMTKHWNRIYNVDVIGVLRGKYLTPAFALKIGETAIRNCIRDQLSFLREESFEYMGNHPLVFTEIGIPYDMDDKYAYKTGDYSSQTSAMDANHFALEGCGANGFTLWVYMTYNNHKWGDHWNGEDLSIFSTDDLELPSAKALGIGNSSINESTASLDRNSPSYSTSRSNADSAQITAENAKGALPPARMASRRTETPAELTSSPGFRAADAYVRPSPIVSNGNLLKHGFDLRQCTFTLSLEAKAATPEDAPTVVYLPEYHFPSTHTEVSVSGGKWTIDIEEIGSSSVQLLRWWHAEGDQDITIRGVKRKPGVGPDNSEDEGYLEQCQQTTCTVM